MDNEEIETRLNLRIRQHLSQNILSFSFLSRSLKFKYAKQIAEVVRRICSFAYGFVLA
jgi:hypothetical protein